MLERHYTVAELAAAWSISEETIRRKLREYRDLYERCLLIYRKRRGTRVYVTIRIPESVANELYRRLLGGQDRAA